MSTDARQLRDGLVRAAPSTPVVPVVETDELRRFTAGHAPRDVVSWFTRGGTAGAIEERFDMYRLDDRPDVGVKRRFGKTLELKLRRSVGESCRLSPLLSGPLERWCRWSPADDRVALTGEETWIEVSKSIVKRRFSMAGDELVVSPVLPEGGGCDVELTDLVVGPVHAWSFALAAFGPAGDRSATLTVAWQMLSREEPCPEGFDAGSTFVCGYPQWLSSVTDVLQATRSG